MAAAATAAQCSAPAARREDGVMSAGGRDWRSAGVRVVRSSQLDGNTTQTPGMHRMTAVDRARAGAERLWAGTAVIEPGARTGAHHHGPLESVIYVISGRARM